MAAKDLFYQPLQFDMKDAPAGIYDQGLPIDYNAVLIDNANRRYVEEMTERQQQITEETKRERRAQEMAAKELVAMQQESAALDPETVYTRLGNMYIANGMPAEGLKQFAAIEELRRKQAKADQDKLKMLKDFASDQGLLDFAYGKLGFAGTPPKLSEDLTYKPVSPGSTMLAIGKNGKATEIFTAPDRPDKGSKKSGKWMHRMAPDGSYTSEKVSDIEVPFYQTQGWIVGEKPAKETMWFNNRSRQWEPVPSGKQLPDYYSKKPITAEDQAKEAYAERMLAIMKKHEQGGAVTEDERNVVTKGLGMLFSSPQPTQSVPSGVRSKYTKFKDGVEVDMTPEEIEQLKRAMQNAKPQLR